MKSFLWKKKFSQSPKSTKICSFKYNGYRSVINIAQKFGHVHNNNFNLCTRQIYFIDQNCAILRSWKITKRSRKGLDSHFLWMSILKTLTLWHVQFTGQEKNIWKMKQGLKFTFQIMPLLNNHQYQHYPKYKMTGNEL